MKLKVKDIISILKKMDGNLPVYIADHDHGTYETNGPAYSCEEVNQEEAEENGERIDPEFEIKGPYCVIRVG